VANIAISDRQVVCRGHAESPSEWSFEDLGPVGIPPAARDLTEEIGETGPARDARVCLEDSGFLLFNCFSGGTCGTLPLLIPFCAPLAPRRA